jgi:hypothetical protein
MCSLSRRFSEQWLRALNHWRQMREETDGVNRPPAESTQVESDTTVAPAQAAPVATPPPQNDL